MKGRIKIKREKDKTLRAKKKTCFWNYWMRLYGSIGEALLMVVIHRMRCHEEWIKKSNEN